MARIIRAQRMGPAVVPAAVYDAQREAAEIRERAEEQAETLRKRACEDGYAAGTAAAARELFHLDKLQATVTERTEAEATQAALMVASQLLGTTLEAEPQRVVELLKPHLARMRRAQRLLLRLHPDDAAWLSQHPEAVDELRGQHTIASKLELLSDPDVARGGCIVESNIGDLDARVETRLTLLAAALGLPTQAIEAKLAHDAHDAHDAHEGQEGQEPQEAEATS